MNPHAEPSETRPAISALPPPDPLDTARQELAAAQDKLRRAEQRILALDEERGKLAAVVEKLDGNPLILALRHLDAGAVLKEAGEKTAELFALCQQLQGKGKMQLTLAVAPSEGKNRAMVYAADVKVTDPKEEATTAFMFVTADGKLTRDNWGERELPRREEAP